MVSSNGDLIKPNILFLIFDSFRADKISGSTNNSLTPNFDYIKRNGVVFDHAISSGDGTLVSYAGLFSGKHPFKTGMVQNFWQGRSRTDSVTSKLIKPTYQESIHSLQRPTHIQICPTKRQDLQV